MKVSMRFVLVLLPFCAVSCSSPTKSINFHPPAGWRASPTFFGFQAWRNENDTQTLVLMRFPVHIDAKDAFNRTDFNDFQTSRMKHVKICGQQPAMLFEGRGTNSRTHREKRVDMIWTAYSSSTYMAIYSRNLNLPTNAEAERAIRSLCLTGLP